MSNIRKRGLDYMPLDVNFLYERPMARLMHDEGVAAPMVYITTLMHIYGEEGSYIVADDHFFGDLSLELHRMDEAQVERIIMLCIDYGLFDRQMWTEHRVLTSVEIQQQYLHVVRRRRSADIPAEYRLIDPATGEVIERPTTTTATTNGAAKTTTDATETTADATETTADAPAIALPKTENSSFTREACLSSDAISASSTEAVHTTQPADTEPPTNVRANGAQYVANCPHSIAKHSIAKHSIAKHSKENPPSSYGVPPQDEARMFARGRRKEGGGILGRKGDGAAGPLSGLVVAAVGRARRAGLAWQAGEHLPTYTVAGAGARASGGQGYVAPDTSYAADSRPFTGQSPAAVAKIGTEQRAFSAKIGTEQWAVSAKIGTESVGQSP